MAKKLKKFVPQKVDYWRYATVGNLSGDNLKHFEQLFEEGLLSREQDRFHCFKSTAKGLLFWSEHEFARGLQGSPDHSWWKTEPEDLLPYFELGGVGTEITICYQLGVAGAMHKAIASGLVELVAIKWGYFIGMDALEALTIRLTAKGMEYFDALPRLVLECA